VLDALGDTTQKTETVTIVAVVGLFGLEFPRDFTFKKISHCMAMAAGNFVETHLANLGGRVLIW
jgi:hypothetical protein